MTDIKTMIEVLRMARDLIDAYAESSVCAAIYAASGEEHIPPNTRRIRAGRYLRRWVMEMLSPHVSIFMWLERQGIPVNTMYDENPDMLREKLRVTRHAWIDWMIHELEKELG